MKFKKIFTSILLMILVFLCFSTTQVNASFFDREDDKSDIEKTIDADDGGLFEKIIAKMIGGVAEGIFDLTTNKEFGVGFKEYDELIFANTDNNLAPFTNEQWNKIMQWYKVMVYIAGVPILIAVILLSYKIMIGGFNTEKRNEAKDNILRLFFGAVAITLAPLFVKLMLYINNNLVKILVIKANGSLDDLLGNSLLSNIRTGNAILTALVIAMFAYLFVKLNVKFIIRQFTILIFTIFTPIVATMWILNRRAIGASIWFGQILINTFMQFIYAFLFLVYLNFIPTSSGWAVSLLWALMILPLAEVLQNTLQNLVSRVAGVPSEEISNRGIGMAAEMAYTMRAFAYQFKSNQGGSSSSSILSNFMNKTSIIKDTVSPSSTNPVVTKNAETHPVETKPIEPKNSNTNPINAVDNKQDNIMKPNIMNKPNTSKQNNIQSNIQNKFSPLEMAAKAGGAFFNAGMYLAEGRNFRNSNLNRRIQNRNNINNTRKDDYRKKEEIDNITKIEMDNHDK